MNIDRIARAMVDVEPSADLESRIRARVRAVPPMHGTAWWSWRLVLPVGAAAATAIILGVQLSRSSSMPNEAARAGAVAQAGNVSSSSVPQVSSSSVPQVSSSSVPQVSSSSVPHVSSSSPRIAASQTLRRSAARVSRATDQLSAEELAWMDRRIPALDQVASLQVERLGVESIQPEPLAITPLTMTPVATEGMGGGRNDR